MTRIFRYSVSNQRQLDDGISAYLATLGSDPARWTLLEWSPAVVDSALHQHFQYLITSKVFDGFINRQKLYVVLPEEVNVESALTELRKHRLFLLPAGGRGQ